MKEAEKIKQTSLLDFQIRIQGRNLTLTELKEVLHELGISEK